MLNRDVVRRRVNIRDRFFRALILLMVPALLTVQPLASQTHPQNVKPRKLITRVEPEYPVTLKRLNIGGVVRVEVVIAPDGTVKSTTLVGGSPILGQAAITAIKEWKYAPAASAETRIERLEFDPHL
jgi:TonB family protein